MSASKLYLFLCLFLSASAFTLEAGTHEDVTKACDVAISTEINCHRKAISFLNGGWYGSLENDTLTDAVCTDACSRSLRDWVSTVSEDCEDEDKARAGLRIWAGWNATCLKDTKTGRYCNDIILDFTDRGEDKELPLKELCHPCYVKRIEMYKPSPYALNIKWHEEQLELVRKKCSGSDPTETSTFVSEETAPVTTAEVSKASHEANSEEEYGLLTESPEQTASSEPTVSSTPNAAAKTNQGQMLWSWSLILLLSMKLSV